MLNRIFHEAGPAQTRILIFATLGMIAIIGSALAFEHVGGYAPCALCLEQRGPYYLGIPFMVIGSLAALLQGPSSVIRGALMIGFACLVATALMGIYHAGVEWQFWAGPDACSAGITGEAGNAGDLLSSLSTAKPPSCTEAAGRLLGISFAGWNVLAASALSMIAARGAFGPSQ